jgi:hypothetical protein
MAEKSSATHRQEGVDPPQGAEQNGTGPDEAQRLAARFDPFHDPYLLTLLRALGAMHT